jgi:uncharacterized protein involved in exopolysaccharide biosynthesis
MAESLFDIFGIIVEWRRFIVWFVLLCTMITGVVTFFLPKWYRSTASVFPADQTDLFSGLDGMSNLVKSFSSSKKLSSLGGPTEVDRYVAILRSNTVLLAVIDSFDLVNVYGFSDSPYKIEKATKELSANSEIEIQDEGSLTISVFDKDPQRAANIANCYVGLLNLINSKLKVQNARGNRVFIEQRYNKNREDIRHAEEAMRSFQMKYGVIAMPEQTEASIKAGAEAAARLAGKEIELAVLKRELSVDHPNVKAAEIEVDELRKKIREMNTGLSGNSDNMNILVPFKQTPELGIQYIRLFREVEIQYKILQFITPLFEQAKVEEQRGTPSVVVLDRAVPAERKAKPRLSLYALMAFVISSLISLFVVFSAEGIARIRLVDPQKFDALIKTAWADKIGLRWKRKKP